jgi:hypothetical protein
MTTLTTCRWCSGDVDTAAQKCRHCGEWLTARPAPPAAQAHTPAPTSNHPSHHPEGALPRAGWTAAAALALGTVLPFLQVPIFGGVSLWNASKLDAGIVVAAAALVAYGGQQGTRRLVLLGALAASVIVGWDAFSVLRAGGEAAMFVSFGVGFWAMAVGCAAAWWSAFREND